jgi:hypothetical protein
MAVYQGARPRGLGAGYQVRGGGSATDALGPPIPRRRGRTAIRAGRSRVPVGTLLGGIVLVFVLAFFSLAQAVRVSASNYEVDRLAVERDRLQSRQRELQSDLNRLGSEPAIRKLAFDAGLGQLDAPIILPAR